MIRATALEKLSRIRSVEGDIDEAVSVAHQVSAEIDLVLDLSPEKPDNQILSAEIHRLLAAYHVKSGKSDDAIKHIYTAIRKLESVLEADPQLTNRKSLVDALSKEAAVLFQRKRLAETADQAGRALQLIESRPAGTTWQTIRAEQIAVHQLCGWSLMFSGKPEQAITHWQAIVDLTGDDPCVVHAPDGSASEEMWLSASEFPNSDRR